MPGQGAIIAAGAIDYPAEYQGSSPELRAMLGISKVMTLTCTYDHRIIQGAESGMFLGRMQELLDGADGFYEEIFEHLKMPHQPRALGGRPRSRCCPADRRAHAEIAKEAGVIQLINAYRVRGHLIADLDPLGAEPQLSSRTRPVNLRPHHLGFRSRIPHRLAWRKQSVKADRSRSPRCAKSSKRCARPTAARSDAST